MTWGELRSGKDRVLSNADCSTAEQAIAELLWNSLDAEATEIVVTIETNELGGATKIILKDNGTGIPHSEAHDLFLTEGDSWKKDKRFSPNIARPMHGQLGRGRLLVYSVAEQVEWASCGKGTDSEPGKRYTISGSRSKPTGFEISDETSSSNDEHGTKVTLHLRDTQKATRVADSGFKLKLLSLMAESISSINCSIVWDNDELDPKEVIDRRDTLTLPPLEASVLRGHEQPSLVVVEWSKRIGTQRLQLCDEAGSTISDYKPTSVPPAPFTWTAYLKWPGFRDPELMGIADLHAPEFKHSELLSTATELLNSHLATRLQAERGNIVREWISEGVYPFDNPNGDVAMDVERELFDIVAVIASPSVPKRGTDQKRLTLRLLKEALRAEPGRLRTALDAVMDLPDEDLLSLERLLKRTELSAIVRASSKVADRLDFLDGLASLLYADDTRQDFREVDQLHPMLVNEPWVFGDEWSVCLSEHGLTRVVESAVKAKNKDAVLALEPVTLPDGKRGRVDLLFHKTVPESEQQRHLVVELKRPGKLTMDHYAQVAGYATAITEHPEIVNTATKWDFWLVGSDLDKTLSNERTTPSQHSGLVKDFGTHRIWVVRWGELIDSLRQKFENYRSGLELVPTESTGLQYLRRTHAEYLPDAVADESATAAADSDS